jgi:hypothetical protein
MNDFRELLDHMARIPGALAAVAAFFGLLGALVTVLVTRFVLGPRDRQDREAEWRKHAIELSKLDLDRKLKTRAPDDTTPLRPSILDFLANYRDLQELGSKSPKELYLHIEEKRIAARTKPPPMAPSPAPRTGPGRVLFVTALILGTLLARKRGDTDRSRSDLDPSESP